MKRNRYSVSKRVWNKWSKEAQDMFNSCYSWTYNNQTNASHPNMPKINMIHWETIAWNIAWIAANYRDNQITRVVK